MSGNSKHKVFSIQTSYRLTSSPTISMRCWKGFTRDGEPERALVGGRDVSKSWQVALDCGGSVPWSVSSDADRTSFWSHTNQTGHSEPEEPSCPSLSYCPLQECQQRRKKNAVLFCGHSLLDPWLSCLLVDKPGLGKPGRSPSIHFEIQVDSERISINKHAHSPHQSSPSSPQLASGGSRPHAWSGGTYYVHSK